MVKTWITGRMVLAALLAFMAASALMTPALGAQTNIPVLVVADDENPRSVKRSSPIFKRVIARVNEELFAKGFRVMDEDFLAAETSWKITDRRSKSELVKAAKAANKTALGALHSRALVLLRINAAAKDQGFAKEAMVRVEGELYDLESNQFLGAFDGARDSFSVPASCGGPCLNELVGDRARELAEPLADVLTTKLLALSVDRVSGLGGDLSPNGGDPRCQSMASSYTLMLNGFDLASSREIIETMTGEFPCVVSHDRLPDGPGNVARYGYVSTATRAKLESWLTILLLDMQLQPGKDVDIRFGQTSIELHR